MVRLSSWTFQNASPRDQMLYMSGVPQRYWRYTYKHVQFTAFSKRSYDKRESYTIDRQAKDWKALLKAPETPRTVCVASAPTDHQAMVAATALAKIRLGKIEQEPMAYKAVRFVNSSTGLAYFLKEEERVSMLVLYNIMEDAPRERLQNIRDYLTAINDALVVLALGSSTSPLDFMWDKLHLPVDMCFWSTQNVSHRTVI